MTFVSQVQKGQLREEKWGTGNGAHRDCLRAEL